MSGESGQPDLTAKVHQEADSIVASTSQPTPSSESSNLPIADKFARMASGESQNGTGIPPKNPDASETALSPEDELRGQYTKLKDTLNILEINEATANYPSWIHESQFIGLPGNFAISTTDNWIHISRNYDGPLHGQHNSRVIEVYDIRSDGQAYYSHRESVITKKANPMNRYDRDQITELATVHGSTYKNETQTHPSYKGIVNEAAVVAGFTKLNDELAKSIKAPEHAPTLMHEQLLAFRQPLEEELAKRGITPKSKTIVAENIFDPVSGSGKDAQNLLTPEEIDTGTHDSQALIEVGEHYRVKDLFGVTGNWEVWFDVDAPNYEKSVGLEFVADPDEFKRRGTGIFLTHTSPEGEYNERREEFTLWENGDARYSSRVMHVYSKRVNKESDSTYYAIKGSLSDPNIPTPPYRPNLRNPHLVYSQFMGLRKNIELDNQTVSPAQAANAQ
jgi:hypothetical protein